MESPTTANVKNGTLRGTVADGVASFKGIPFAQPPIGEMRWRPPAPAAVWSGVRDATGFKPDCMQLPFPGDAASPRGPVSEDCLYLNVWAPSPISRSELPVLVWVPGGAFVNGGTSREIYNGSALAAEGLVVVTINYRLGRFGFFAHPSLTAESRDELTANYGFMDQIAALNWVRDNISAFGGDHTNVTLFGESAGALSVQVLMNSSLSKSLFGKAIIQSAPEQPSGSMNFPPLQAEPGMQSGESVGETFARQFNITGSDAATAVALRRLSAEEVLGGLNMGTINNQGSSYSGPVVDGRLLSKPIDDGVMDGDAINIPVIIGTNNADGTFSNDDAAAFYKTYGKQAPLAQALYDPSGTKNPRMVTLEGFGDQWFREPARWFSKELSRRGHSIYQYRFSYVATKSRSTLTGAPHSSEIPYIFGTVKSIYGDSTSLEDETMANAVRKFWVSFSKTGVPVGEGVGGWPKYSEKSDIILDFTVVGPIALPDPLKVRLDLAAARRGR